jgi:hypothetical protein
VEPIHEHWMDANNILRYLHGTITYGLRYALNTDVQLDGFTDSDWEGSVDNKKSTSGMCFSMGSSMISWTSRKHKYVALDTT